MVTSGSSSAILGHAVAPPGSGFAPDRRTVLIYITHGDLLLVLDHPDHPDAGLQVPGGSVAAGEAWGDAAQREAAEETGLAGLPAAMPLGEQWWRWTMPDRTALDQRQFFWIPVESPVPERWEHWETDPGDGGPPVRFAFSWRSLRSALPPLIAGHDALVDRLRARLEIAAPARPAGDHYEAQNLRVTS